MLSNLRSPTAVSLLQLGWCLVGAAAGLGLALVSTEQAATPLLLASLGGTTVFLFGLTRAPAAQPRALFGGHLGGAAIGIACYQVAGESTAVYGVAVALTLGWMLAARVVHPPAGANPIIMVHAHASWGALANPVLLSLLCLAGVAWAWSRAWPRQVRYPADWRAPSPPTPLWGAWDPPPPSHEDRSPR